MASEAPSAVAASIIWFGRTKLAGATVRADERHFTYVTFEEAVKGFITVMPHDPSCPTYPWVA
ncbi:MAG: hypothetical protein WDN46_19590 [Methylocella sp.]